MLLYLSITGVVLSAILFYFNIRKHPSVVFLSLFFFTMSLNGLIQYALLYSDSVQVISILYVNVSFAPFLTGPMLYFYIRSLLTDRSRLKRWDYVHFAPALIYLVASLPHLFSSYTYKTEVATAILTNDSFLRSFSPTILSELFSIPVMFLIRPVLVMLYTLWSIALFVWYVRKQGNIVIFWRHSFVVKWLSVLFSFQLILITSYLLSMIKVFTESAEVFYTLNVLQIFSAAGLIGLLLSPFFFPEMLYGFLEAENPIRTVTREEEREQLPFESKKSNLSFETEYLLSIGEKAERCMKELQPYLQPEFSMTQFSVLTQVPVHHLAHYFREERKQSFNDFRDEWRIRFAKELIIEGKADGMTLEAIGLQSGFVTRNTFTIAFKKAEGISPRDFVSQFKK